MIQKSLFRTLGVGVVLAGGLAFGSAANAAPIETFMHAGLNTFTDNSAELFVNKGGGATTVDVGDIFLGAIEIDSINNVAIGTSTGNNEFSGVFGLRVTSVTPLGGGLAFFEFGAVNDLRGEFLAATGVDIGATPAGTFGKFFEDSTPDALRDGSTFSAFVGTSTDGNLRLRIGMVDGDITSVCFGDVGAIANPLIAPGSGLPCSFNNEIGGGPVVAEENFGFDFVGPLGISGATQKPVPPEDFTVRDDATIVATLIPEPTTLGLFGAALLAFGFAGRRRNQI